MSLHKYLTVIKLKYTHTDRHTSQRFCSVVAGSASQSDGQDEERGSDVSEMVLNLRFPPFNLPQCFSITFIQSLIFHLSFSQDEKSEGRVTRRGRRSAAAAAKDSSGMYLLLPSHHIALVLQSLCANSPILD